jgi:hypothetical protein
MGQQQLILLVLGTIIVGVAIVVGINVFSSGAVKANQEAVAQDNMTVASRAINFARTPVDMGGGFNTTTGVKSFDGISLDKLKWQTPNANGAYTMTAGAGNTFTVSGVGNEPNVTVVTTVTLNAAAPPTIVTTY